jgi:anaerobic magnesium-protoporphyrin IX monomethyl ester cyclase
MVRELMPHDIGVSVSYPLPGTLFFEKVKDQLNSKRNWEDSDDLAMMYEGPYPASFYRQLHRYVHRDFRSRQQRTEVKKGNGIFKNASHAVRSAAYRMLARVNYVFLSTADGRL